MLTPEVTALLKRSSEFTAKATESLAKAADDRAAFEARVPGIVDEMIKRGAAEPTAREGLTKTLLEGGQTKSAQLMEFLVGCIQPQTLGGPSTQEAPQKSAKVSSDDAFDNKLFGRAQV